MINMNAKPLPYLLIAGLLGWVFPAFGQVKALGNERVEGLFQIVRLEEREVIKKLHVDTDESLEKVLAFSLNSYEQGISQVESKYQSLISTSLREFDKKLDEIEDEMDFEAVLEQINLLKITLSPLEKEFQEVETQLNSRLQLSLSEKQFKQWKHYFERKKKNHSGRTPMPMAGPTAKSMVL